MLAAETLAAVLGAEAMSCSGGHAPQRAPERLNDPIHLLANLRSRTENIPNGSAKKFT